MILLFISFFSLMVCAIEDYSSFFTTAIIQELQAPTNIIQQINSTNPEYINPIVLKYGDVYVKHNISRIIGKNRIEESIVKRSIGTFEVPEKFLLPVFTKRGGLLDSCRSRVISMHVENKKIATLSDQEVWDIVHIVEDSRIYDMNGENLRRSFTGTLVMLDTEILVDDLPNKASLLFAFSCLKQYKKSIIMDERIAQLGHEIIAELTVGKI